ncbi:hypothetical protein CR513_10250, partial [Mucuna pruriens]
MSLYLTVCKRKIGCREIRLKVFILLRPLKIRKERTLRVLRKGLLKERNKRRMRNLLASSLRICSEVNLTFVPMDTWWVDSVATSHISSFRQNLINISNLNKFGFSCSFGNNKVSLYQNSNVIGSSFLVDNLYMFDVVSSHNKIFQIGS